MNKASFNNLPAVVLFQQTLIEIGETQILTASDQLFNHVDENLPMWSEEGDRIVAQDIIFVKAFRTKPAIMLGLVGIDGATDQNLRFWLHAKNVRKDGFTIEFSTWFDTHIARAAVSWQAIGPAKPDILEAASKSLRD